MKSLSLLFGSIFVLAGFTQASAQTLSEFRLDMPGTDTEEFVELAGAVGASLDGISFVILGDSGSTNFGGQVETAVDMTGHVINANGFFVLAKSTFTLGVADLTDDGMSFENSDNVTYMLISGFTGAVGDDLDTTDDGILDGLTGTIIDSLSIIESIGSGDIVYGSQSIGPDGSFVPATGWLCDSGSWMIGGFSDLAGNTAGADNDCTPSNDDCAGAISASAGANAMDNTEATTSGEATCTSVNKDLWYAFTATSDANHSFDTCAASGDSKIAVFDGACGSLVCLGSNDDSCGLLSSVTIPMVNGQTVLVQAGAWSATGVVIGDLTITNLGGPAPGDDCGTAAAAVLGANPFDTTANTTSGLSEPSCNTAAIHNDTFFTYTAGAALDHSFATCGADIDTKIRVYDVDCAGACLGYNDDACAMSSGQNWASELIVPLAMGQTVIVQVGGWGAGDAGLGALTISEIIPGNDCADALAAGLGATPFDTSINTTSGLDGVCSTDTIHGDIFFSFTALTAGDHSVETCGSDIDTKIRVYDTDCAGACLAYNDDACAMSSGQNWASQTTVTLAAGQTVIVQVGGWGAGDLGTGSLTITELGGPPPNDGCGGAIALAVGANAFDNAPATTSGEAGCTSVNKDLWYSYTAGRDGDHTFDTCAAAGDSKMAVFDGACGSLVCLGFNDDSCGLLSSVTVPMVIGQTVLVQAGAWSATGVVAGDLTVTEPSLCEGVDDAFSTAFSNHSCASAVAMPNGLFNMVVCKDRPDFYSFIVEAGATVRAEIQFDTSVADLDLFLYDAAACSDDQNSGCGGTLACGFSGSNNELAEWTNTTGADMACIMRVNVWPNDAGEINGYNMGLGGTLDPNTSVFCAPANVNSSGGSVSLDTSSSQFGGMWINATGGPDGEFGFVVVAATKIDPGVVIADGILCLTGQIGRYSSAAGVNFPARNSTGNFAPSPTGGSSVFFTANDNGVVPGAPGFLVPAELPFPPGGLIAPGDQYHYQMWYRDGASSNFSDGVTVNF